MKNLKNLGKTLSKAEQKEVNGGKRPLTTTPRLCVPKFRPTNSSCAEIGLVPFIDVEGNGFCCEGN